MGIFMLKILFFIDFFIKSGFGINSDHMSIFITAYEKVIVGHNLLF